MSTNSEVMLGTKIMNSARNVIFVVTLSFGSLCSVAHGCDDVVPVLQMTTLYGNFVVHEPVLHELFDSQAMQRIKGVQQYGIAHIVKRQPSYTRYDHCIGVWALLRKYGAPLAEQIAGLLHDASHPAFSHIGDHLFAQNLGQHGYQDNIHEWYLLQTDVPGILAKYGMKLGDVLPSNGKCSLLEQDLPDICADRLEYNLQGGLLVNLLTEQDIEKILNDVTIEHGKWYFTSVDSARKLALVSTYLTEYEWGSPGNHVMYRLFANVLRHAMTIGLISHQDVHFSTDDVLWQVLSQHNDQKLKQQINDVVNFRSLYALTTNERSLAMLSTKFRGINPLVVTDDGLKRLTDLDQCYKHEFLRVKNLVAAWPVWIDERIRTLVCA